MYLITFTNGISFETTKDGISVWAKAYRQIGEILISVVPV